MFLLALHIVSITLLVMIVWSVAYRAGEKRAERRLRRLRELEAEEAGAPALGRSAAEQR